MWISLNGKKVIGRLRSVMTESKRFGITSETRMSITRQKRFRKNTSSSWSVITSNIGWSTCLKMNTPDRSHLLSPLRGLTLVVECILRACARSYMLWSLRDWAMRAVAKRGNHLKILNFKYKNSCDDVPDLVCLCTESGSGEDKLRTWTNASGKKKILLKLVRVAGNITTKNEKGNEIVAFEDANGKRYQTLVKNLSEFDQEFLAKIKRELKPTDPAPSAPDARLPEKHQAFFTAHCLDCHDSQTQEGKVDLETLSFHITTIEQAELWQKVLSALNSGEMPPKDSQQPGNKEKADFLDDLSLTMVTARKDAVRLVVAKSPCGDSTSATIRTASKACWGYDSVRNSCPMMVAPATLIRSELRSFSPVTSLSSI